MEKYIKRKRICLSASREPHLCDQVTIYYIYGNAARHPTGLALTMRHYTVNACLAPLCSLHGLAVTTVEGIGSTKTTLHPVQVR